MDLGACKPAIRSSAPVDQVDLRKRPRPLIVRLTTNALPTWPMPLVGDTDHRRLRDGGVLSRKPSISAG